MVSSNIKEFVACLKNPCNSLCFIPFLSAFPDSQWQQFPKCFQCGSTMMLNLISLMQIYWYSCSDSRAAFLRRVRLKPTDNSSRVVSAAAYIGTHFGSWDKIKKNVQKAQLGKTLGCAVGLCCLTGGDLCAPSFCALEGFGLSQKKKVFHSDASRWLNNVGMN